MRIYKSRTALDAMDALSDRFLLFAEGDDDSGGGGADDGSQGDADTSGDDVAGEGAKEGAGEAGDSAEKVPDDWRASIENAGLRKIADRHDSVTSLTQAVSDLRKRESTSIRALGKEPTDEEVATYRKAIGVPENVDGYEFAMPEGQEATDADKAFQGAAAETFHGLNISAEQAQGLNTWWNGVQAAAVEQQINDDKTYADETEAKLKAEWPGKEFELNTGIADQAAAKVFGDAIDDARHIETKDGRFILDHPIFIKMLAQIGREMQEGRIGNLMTDGERGGVESQIREVEGKIDRAKASGDRALANKLYQDQQALYGQIHGSKPIVGAEGRTA